MIYDITRTTPPEMPTLGKGLETQKLLLSQTSKDMFQPEQPMLYAPLGAKISGAEFQYPSGQWLEPCGQISLLCADSGNNKGQHISITRQDDGTLRPNFKPMKMDEMFNVDNYAFEVYRELRKALTGLVEEK